jgi:hypothetical protein
VLGEAGRLALRVWRLDFVVKFAQAPLLLENHYLKPEPLRGA